MEEGAAGAGEPLIELPLTPQQRVANRLRLLRIAIGCFVVFIVIFAVVTGSRLMHIAARQTYVDDTFPACRKGYTIGVAGGENAGSGARLVLWSGKSQKRCEKNELCDDMWLFDARADVPTNHTSKWTQIDKQGRGAYLHSDIRPEPRWKASAVQGEGTDGDLVVFAGDPLRPDRSYMSDVWRLDTAALQWTRVQATCGSEEDGRDGDGAPAQADEAPCDELPRRAHDGALIGRTMYVYGGKNANKDLLNDVWALDLVDPKWTMVYDATAEDIADLKAPVPRKGHSLVAAPATHSRAAGADAPALVLFGGRNGSHYFNDVWLFFPQERVWEAVDAGKKGKAHHLAPPARDHHSAVVVGETMYMMSGWVDMVHAFDDLWAFDLRTHTWAQVPQQTPFPAARFLVNLVALGDWFYLFGGELGGDGPHPNKYRNDVWAFNTKTSTWRELSTNQCPRKDKGRV